MIRNCSLKLLSLVGVMFALTMCSPIGPNPANQAPTATLPAPTATSALTSEPPTSTPTLTPPTAASTPTSEPPTSTPTATPPTATPTSTPRPTRANTPPPTPCAQPQIGSLTINPNEIKRGDTATLNWGAVTNANKAEIDQNIGGVPAPGSRQVRPDRDTTYTLTAFGCSNATAQASIMVLLIGKGDAGIPNGPRSYSPQMQFNWSNRSLFNSDNHSGIEIETNRGGSYQPFERNDNFVLGQNYVNKKNFQSGKYKVRFRWWQVDPQSGKRISLKSEWSVICFNYNSNERCD